MEERCIKCDSSKIIPNVCVSDQGEGSDGRLKVVIAEEPDAPLLKSLLFNKYKFSAIRARVCGECGHMELRVEDPSLLYEAYLRSRG